MFDDVESDEELETFVQAHHPAKLSKKELNNAKARIRGAISRESKASKQRAESMASFIINHAQQRAAQEGGRHDVRKRRAHGVVMSVSKLSSAVLNSLEVRAPVYVSSHRHSSVAWAHTDFKNINISVNVETYRDDDRDSLASLIHMTKGLVYHEGGHIKWTTPFPNLLDMAGRSDIPSSDKYRLARAWNVLEDQRMETAMCSISPVMSRYFTNIVLNVVLNLSDLGANWPWIAGRTYLPSDIRQAIRDAAEQRDVNNIVDDMTKCIMRYRRSKSAAEMVDCVIEFRNYLELWGTDPRGADRHTWDSEEQDSQAVPMPSDIPDAPDPPVDKPSPGVTKPSKSETPADGVEDAPPQAESDGEEGRGTGAPSSDTRTTPDVESQRSREETLRNRISEETSKNINTVKDAEIEDFVASVNEHSSKPVLDDPSMVRMTDEETKRTVDVTNSMMSVLERLVVQVEPTWHSYMEDGVLDPTLFRLRDPGDTNFWSGLDGDGNNGHDIAVSVLIDSSGSMGGRMNTVSIAAMGIRKACEQLEIPCTLTTFNDDVYMVADANESVDYVRVAATGGTSIINAMMALDDQRCGKAYHLVVILTDGEWSDVSDTRLWAHPTRSINIVGFGHGMASYISNKGADHWIVIDDLMELPNIVTDSLVQHFV